MSINVKGDGNTVAMGNIELAGRVVPLPPPQHSRICPKCGSTCWDHATQCVCEFDLAAWDARCYHERQAAHLNKWGVGFGLFFLLLGLLLHEWGDSLREMGFGSNPLIIAMVVSGLLGMGCFNAAGNHEEAKRKL